MLKKKERNGKSEREREREEGKREKKERRKTNRIIIKTRLSRGSGVVC